MRMRIGAASWCGVIIGHPRDSQMTARCEVQVLWNWPDSDRGKVMLHDMIIQ